MVKKSKKTNGKGYTPPLYKAYLFTQKDPVIDQLRTLAEDSFRERINGKNLREIEKGGGPKVGTMRHWFFGKTKRPNNATIEACGRSLGFERKWSKLK
jgi:hypothetical protein